MPLKHCPNCLSRSGLFALIWPDETRCRHCGEVPTCQLTPKEVRACLKAEVEP